MALNDVLNEIDSARGSQAELRKELGVKVAMTMRSLIVDHHAVGLPQHMDREQAVLTLMTKYAQKVHPAGSDKESLKKAAADLAAMAYMVDQPDKARAGVSPAKAYAEAYNTSFNRAKLPTMAEVFFILVHPQMADVDPREIKYK